VFRKLIWWFFALLLVVLALWFFRYPLLRATGNVLIKNDPLHHADAIYVLGGASVDRGVAAAELLQKGLAPIAYCTGENIPQSLLGEGLLITEAQLTTNVMLHEGAQDVLPIPEGTSTWDESHIILDHARQLAADTIIVVTTDFHSRRVGRVFRSPFRKAGITVLVYGAPASVYDAQRWWETEEGLLMVNNEYVKLLYYWLKY
jgi:uncharacterized SAM-binding protein YcdF (DUF218 family)